MALGGLGRVPLEIRCTSPGAADFDPPSAHFIRHPLTVSFSSHRIFARTMSIRRNHVYLQAPDDNIRDARNTVNRLLGEFDAALCTMYPPPPSPSTRQPTQIMIVH